MAPCHYVDLGGGSFAHIRMSKRPARKCKFCFARMSTLLCDYPTGPGKKTCDAPMCRQCGTAIATEIDYCPTHKDFKPQASLFETEPTR